MEVVVNTQSVTLASYSQHIQGYVGERVVVGTERTANYWPGVEFFLGQLQPSQTIFEIGSGMGFDAQHMEEAGFQVRRSDATGAFLELLQAAGHEAEQYDVLAGPPPEKFTAIFANAVLLHFAAEQLERALNNIHAGLELGGLFCVGMRLGSFEGWRESPTKGRRYFKEWKTDELEKALAEHDFKPLNTFVVPDGSFAILTVRSNF